MFMMLGDAVHDNHDDDDDNYDVKDNHEYCKLTIFHIGCDRTGNSKHHLYICKIIDTELNTFSSSSSSTSSSTSVIRISMIYHQ